MPFHSDSGGDLDEPLTLICPVCGFDYNHLTGATVEVGEDHGNGYAHRPHAFLEFRCENGHDWNLMFYNIKGHMEVTANEDEKEEPGRTGEVR